MAYIHEVDGNFINISRACVSFAVPCKDATNSSMSPHSLVAQMVKERAHSAGDVGWIPGSGRSLEKEMATHSSILAWKVPWTQAPTGASWGRVHEVAKSQTRLSD